LVADLSHRGLWGKGVEEFLGVRSVEFLGDSARTQLLSLIGTWMQSIAQSWLSESAACSRQTTRERWLPTSVLRLANRRSISTWSAAATLASTGVRKAATATEKASLGSFLLDDPEARTLTRAAKVAGTSTTTSPAATSS
jgi:hypothetical protein